MTDEKTLQGKKAETVAHIEAINREEQELLSRAGQLKSARDQMIGRLRFISEELGEIEPLTPPRQELEDEEAEEQGNA